MMYKHVIDECIAREKKTRDTCIQFGRLDEARHYQDKIDSLKRLRKVAPEAKYRATVEETTRKTFEELLRETSTHEGERP